MLCYQCNTENPDYAKYCKKCGVLLLQEQEEEADYTYESFGQNFSGYANYSLNNSLETLDCSESDSIEVIRRKYRELIKKYHPDKQDPNISDQEREDNLKIFFEVKKAYEDIKLVRNIN